ncbi:MAG: helix-turn-helix domain-containing protein [Zoogloeaceae bacterium]|jgi:cytoskeleton protein RodZ|nr:helix-turn-helix domain-containing protein [Zoogloeaceae bacterium]
MTDRATEPLVTPSAPAAPEIQVGEQLRLAREARGLALAELARQLYLGIRQVEALEAGNLAALPGKTFVRGFVRNYANTVQLDAAPLLALLDQVRDLKSPSLELPESTHVVMPGSGRMASVTPNTLLIAAALLLLLAALTLYFWPFDLLPERSPPAPAEEVLTQEVAPLDLPQVDTALPEAVVTPVVPSASGEGLSFKFAGESWVEVRDKDDKLLIARMHTPGETREVLGSPPFALVVGNAAQVQLFYKGQPVTLKPGAGNGVARLTVQ